MQFPVIVKTAIEFFRLDLNILLSLVHDTPVVKHNESYFWNKVILGVMH